MRERCRSMSCVDPPILHCEPSNTCWSLFRDRSWHKRTPANVRSWSVHGGCLRSSVAEHCLQTGPDEPRFGSFQLTNCKLYDNLLSLLLLFLTQNPRIYQQSQPAAAADRLRITSSSSGCSSTRKAPFKLLRSIVLRHCM